MINNYDDLPDLSAAEIKPSKSRSLDVPGIVDDELQKLGYSDNARLALISNLGRENGWNAETIFRGHTDPNPKNRKYNRGIISWQGDRQANLNNFLQKNGGNWTPSENNIRLQTRFLDSEINSKKFAPIGAQMKNHGLSLDDAYPLLQKYILYQTKYEPDNKQWEAKAKARGFGRLPDLSLAEVGRVPDLSAAETNNLPDLSSAEVGTGTASFSTAQPGATQATPPNTTFPVNHTAKTPAGQFVPAAATAGPQWGITASPIAPVPAMPPGRSPEEQLDDLKEQRLEGMKQLAAAPTVADRTRIKKELSELNKPIQQLEYQIKLPSRQQAASQPLNNNDAPEQSANPPATNAGSARPQISPSSESVDNNEAPEKLVLGDQNNPFIQADNQNHLPAGAVRMTRAGAHYLALPARQEKDGTVLNYNLVPENAVRRVAAHQKVRPSAVNQKVIHYGGEAKVLDEPETQVADSSTDRKSIDALTGNPADNPAGQTAENQPAAPEIVETIPLQLVPQPQRASTTPALARRALAGQAAAALSPKYGIPKSDIEAFYDERGFTDKTTNSQLPDEGLYATSTIQTQPLYLSKQDIADIQDYSAKRREQLNEWALNLIASGKELSAEDKEKIKENEIDLKDLETPNYSDLDPAGAARYQKFVQAQAIGDQKKKDYQIYRAEELQKTNDPTIANLNASRRVGWLTAAQLKESTDNYQKMRDEIRQMLLSERQSATSLSNVTGLGDVPAQRGYETDQPITDGEVNDRIAELQKYALSDKEKRESGAVADSYNDLLGKYGSAALSAVLSASGSELHLIAGALRFFGADSAAQKVSKFGSQQQFAASKMGSEGRYTYRDGDGKIQEAEESDYGTTGIKLLGGVLKLPQIALLSETPLGVIGGFALSDAFESAGRGESFQKIGIHGAKGAALGALFGVAGGAGGKVLEKTGSAVLGETTRLGSIFVGAGGLDLAMGEKPKDAFSNAVQMVIFDAIMHHSKTAKEGLSESLSKIKNKVFRVTTQGKSKIVSINDNNEIVTYDKLNNESQAEQDKAIVGTLVGADELSKTEAPPESNIGKKVTDKNGKTRYIQGEQDGKYTISSDPEGRKNVTFTNKKNVTLVDDAPAATTGNPSTPAAAPLPPVETAGPSQTAAPVENKPIAGEISNASAEQPARAEESTPEPEMTLTPVKTNATRSETPESTQTGETATAEEAAPANNINPAQNNSTSEPAPAAAKTLVSDKHYVYDITEDGGEPHFVEVKNASPVTVKGFENVDLFAQKDGDYYRIIEGQSGSALTVWERSKERATEKARQFLETTSLNDEGSGRHYNDIIKTALDRQGLSPRYVETTAERPAGNEALTPTETNGDRQFKQGNDVIMQDGTQAKFHRYLDNGNAEVIDGGAYARVPVDSIRAKDAPAQGSELNQTADDGPKYTKTEDSDQNPLYARAVMPDGRDMVVTSTKDVKAIRREKDALAKNNYPIDDVNETIDRFYKPEKYQDLKGKDNIFLVMPSTSGRNIIPGELAKRLQADFGGEVVEDFASPLNKVEAKTKGAVKKVTNPAFYDVYKDLSSYKGKNIVIVDDVLNTGDTITGLRKELAKQGIHDTQIASLGASSIYTTTPRTIERIAEKIAKLSKIDYNIVYRNIKPALENTFSQYTHYVETSIKPWTVQGLYKALRSAGKKILGDGKDAGRLQSEVESGPEYSRAEVRPGGVSGDAPLAAETNSQSRNIAAEDLTDDLIRVIENDFGPKDLAKSQISPDGKLNEQAFRVMAEAHKLAFNQGEIEPWTGSYLNPENVRRVRAALDQILGGKGEELLKQFDATIDPQYGDAVQIVTSENAPNGLPEAWQEEYAHRADYRVGFEHSVGKEVMQSSADGREGIKNLQNGLAYHGVNDDVASVELTAKLFVEGEKQTGLSEDQKNNLADDYLEALLDKGVTASDIETEFNKIGAKGEEFAENARRKESERYGIQRNPGSNEPSETSRAEKIRFDGEGDREIRSGRNSGSEADVNGRKTSQPNISGASLLEGTGNSDEIGFNKSKASVADESEGPFEDPYKDHQVKLLDDGKYGLLQPTGRIMERFNSQAEAEVELERLRQQDYDDVADKLKRELYDVIDSNLSDSKLIQRTKVRTEGRIVFLDAHGVEFLSRLKGGERFTGLFVNPEQVKDLLRLLNRKRFGAFFKSASKPLNHLIEQIKQAADGKDIIIALSNEKLPRGIKQDVQEEYGHRIDFYFGQQHAISSVIFAAHPLGIKAMNNLKRGSYKDATPEELGSEVAAKVWVDGDNELGLSLSEREELQAVLFNAWRDAGVDTGEVLNAIQEISESGKKYAAKRRKESTSDEGNFGNSQKTDVGGARNNEGEISAARTRASIESTEKTERNSEEITKRDPDGPLYSKHSATRTVLNQIDKAFAKSDNFSSTRALENLFNKNLTQLKEAAPDAYEQMLKLAGTQSQATVEALKGSQPPAANFADALAKRNIDDVKTTLQMAGLAVPLGKGAPPTTVAGKPAFIIKLGNQSFAVPNWLGGELKPALESSKPNLIQRVMGKLNAYGMAGPLDAIFHTANVVGTVIGATPYVGNDILSRTVGNTPATKWLTTLVQFARTSPETVDAQTMRDMAEAGVIPSRYGSETYSKQFAAQLGAHRKLFSLGPMLTGPKGVDIRARIIMWNIGKHINPKASNTEMADFVNQLGIYNGMLESKLASSLKGSQIAPFFTAGSTMLKNGALMWLNKTPMPTGNLSTAQKVGLRFQQQMGAGALGVLGLWAGASFLYRGMLPWDDKESRFLQIPLNDKDRQTQLAKMLYGDNNKTAYVGLGFASPLLERGARGLGISGAYNTAVLGGNVKQSFEAGATDTVNSMLHPIFTGPLSHAVFGVSGYEPQVSSMRDKNGKFGFQFWRKDLPKGAGFGTSLEESALGLNPMLAGIAHSLGVNQGERDEEADKGAANIYLKTIIDLALPRLNKGAVDRDANRARTETARKAMEKQEGGASSDDPTKDLDKQVRAGKMSVDEAKKKILDEFKTGNINGKQAAERTESLTMPEAVQKLNDIKVEGATDFDRIEKLLKSATPADKARLGYVLGKKIVSKQKDGTNQSKAEAQKLIELYQKYFSSENNPGANSAAPLPLRSRPAER